MWARSGTGGGAAAIDGTTIEGIRADLAARVAAIRAGALSARVLAPEVAAIRAIAHRHGLIPAATVARLLDAALARGERGAMLRDTLAALGEAVASERQDGAAGEAFAALCSVRLATA